MPVLEIVLVAAVSAQILGMAYLHHPRAKAFVYSLPFPFTIGTFIVGQGIGVSHVLGLLVLMGYIHGVRLLHHRFRWPIVAAILVSALLYCVVGAALYRTVPCTEENFRAAWILTALVSLLVLRHQPHREEPGHRTPLPPWIKIQLVAVTVVLLVQAKSLLGGFMTTFPLVGVMGAYESRHSLWTMSRQFPRMILCMLLLILVARLLEPAVGLGWGMAAGWAVCLPLLTWLSFRAPR